MRLTTHQWNSLCRSSFDLIVVRLVDDEQQFGLIVSEMAEAPSPALRASASITGVCVSKVAVLEAEPLPALLDRMQFTGAEALADAVPDALALLYAADAGGTQPATLATAIAADTDRTVPVLTVLADISTAMLGLLADHAALPVTTVVRAVRNQVEYAFPQPC